MALKISQIILIILLWLSLFFLLFHEFYNFKSKINEKHTTTTISAYSSTPSHIQPLISRKVLARQFDLSPFVKHHQDQQQQHRRTERSHENTREQPEPVDDQGEIDPRYGVEKRRVPTGPNPLHH
ncbi:hypothetical protein I3760_16G002600 [Carya illinoinensis]|uniref:Uncharacterized protein n=1 Tax=Carya illinoinensis TaxID=32201 RepID=A0A922D3M8_CARIL|nr:hypothetical protein I3760_16G002600 [Carya illinoinensis]KAG6671411.1 hypothetical protein I3842_16G002600 [Carya illinoinensis]